MIADLLANPAESRLLGSGRLRGPMPWVMAIMTFVMVIIAAAGLALAGAAELSASAAQSRYSVEIANGSGRQAEAAERLRQVVGIRTVRPVADSEMRAMLERWLGSSGSADIPLPALIDVELAPDADPVAVAAAVARSFPGAELRAHGEALAPLVAALRSLALLAVVLVLLVAAATAAAVVLATLGALTAHRATIDVMHGVGATDQQIARLFQRRIAVDALAGGLGGALLAALVLTITAATLGEWTAGFGGARLLDLSDLSLLAALPLLAALLATLVARAAVLRALGERL